jgi:transcriptional regulator with XRE-family HTH domain
VKPPKKALGPAVRSLRIERGYTQESFAKHAGLDRSYYSAIERGNFNVTLDTLVKVAAALGVSASTLLRRAKL